jgi:hypothetical protein
MVRAMLKGGNMPKKYWVYAVHNAAYVMNRTLPSPFVEGKTAYEIIHGFKPDFSSLGQFGWPCWAHVEGKLSKLEDRGDPGSFLGCQEGQDGFIVLNPDGSIGVSRSVELAEFRANPENCGGMEDQELSVLSEEASPPSKITRRGPRRTARR